MPSKQQCCGWRCFQPQLLFWGAYHRFALGPTVLGVVQTIPMKQSLLAVFNDPHSCLQGEKFGKYGKMTLGFCALFCKSRAVSIQWQNKKPQSQKIGYTWILVWLLQIQKRILEISEFSHTQRFMLINGLGTQQVMRFRVTPLLPDLQACQRSNTDPFISLFPCASI